MIGEVVMSLIKKTDIEDFIKWAERNEDKDIYPHISKEEDSYYVNRKAEETYMMEYAIRTMEDLQNQLEKFCGISLDSYVLKKLIILMCQYKYRDELVVNRSENYAERVDNEDDTDRTLPEFVYTL